MAPAAPLICPPALLSSPHRLPSLALFPPHRPPSHWFSNPPGPSVSQPLHLLCSCLDSYSQVSLSRLLQASATRLRRETFSALPFQRTVRGKGTEGRSVPSKVLASSKCAPWTVSCGHWAASPSEPSAGRERGPPTGGRRSGWAQEGSLRALLQGEAC